MVPPNNLGPDLSGKAVNETQYRGMIETLMYLNASRHDIQFSTCLYAIYQANPKESHLIAIKRIFRYLKGTPNLGLWYPKCSGFDLNGYSDSDYAGCNMDKKSTSSAYRLLGGKLVCWSAKKAINSYVPIFCDNTSAIAISNNLVLHSRTKHVDIKYHFIRDRILKGGIELHFIPTQYQLADIFTNPLDEPTFKRLIVELEAFIKAPTQYKEYMSKFWYTAKTLDESKIWVSTPTCGIRGDIGGKIGSLDQLSNKDATILYCLANGVKIDCAKLIWEDIIHKLSKKTREKVFSVYNWVLNPNQTEGPPFTDHLKAIYNLDVHVDSKSPKPSLQTEEVPQGKNPGAKIGLRRKQSSKHIFKSKTKASKSKTGQSEKKLNPVWPTTKAQAILHLPHQWLVKCIKRHSKQLLLFMLHSKSASGHDASVDSTAEVDPGLSAHNDSGYSTKSRRDELKITHADSGTNEESRADDILKKIKLEDLSDLLKDTRFAFFTPDSPQDEPIIVSDGSKEEEEVSKDNDIHASSHDVELVSTKAMLKLKFAHCVCVWPHIQTSTRTHWSKELHPKFTKLSREIKEPKKHEKLKTLDFLPRLLNKVTDTLNRFATVVENVSGALTNGVPSTGQATTSPTEGEKNINPATTDAKLNLHDELVNLLGIDVVTQYYNKKLLYDKYCDKMLKRRKSSKITNCDVLTQKDHISLKVNGEDGTSEVISNVKVSDLHLAEWREVVQACPDRKEKG
ncbi:hypothetical protein Tco_1204097 [Tanacetum coccineum]